MKDPWRGVAFGLALVLVVAVGLAVALALATDSPPASTEPHPTAPEDDPTPTLSESAPVPTSSPSDEPSVSASPPGPSPSASPSLSGTATATIRGVKLDAGVDPGGRDRQISFRTDDPATVTVRVSAVSPQGTVDACLTLNGVELYCTSGTTFTMTGQTSRSNATWALTLRGQGAETPELDVTLDFPAAAPTLTIEGAWFDGAARADYNGVVFELVPRNPLVSISASWEGSHPYRLTVQEQVGSGALEFEGTGSAVAQDVLLATELHRIELVNTGAGAERITFTASISWR